MDPRSIIPSFKQPTQLILPRQAQRLTAAVNRQNEVGGVNIRESFNRFIEDYGQMVLVQRLNLSVHCQVCWNEKLGEGDPTCPYCLGRGYLSVLERHLGRKVSSVSEHRSQLMVQSGTGAELVDEVFWFFEYGVNPQAADVVYEVTWFDDAMTIPNRLLSAYEVTYPFPFRGAGGRLEFWRASTKSKPIDRGVVGDHLRRVSSQVMQIPEDGVLRYGLVGAI